MKKLLLIFLTIQIVAQAQTTANYQTVNSDTLKAFSGKTNPTSVQWFKSRSHFTRTAEFDSLVTIASLFIPTSNTWLNYTGDHNNYLGNRTDFRNSSASATNARISGSGAEDNYFGAVGKTAIGGTSADSNFTVWQNSHFKGNNRFDGTNIFGVRIDSIYLPLDILYEKDSTIVSAVSPLSVGYSNHTASVSIADGSNLAWRDSANTFKLKQTVDSLLVNNLTSGYVPYQNAYKLVNSPIYTNGTNVGIGTTSPGMKFQVGNNFGIQDEGNHVVVSSLGSDNAFNFYGNSQWQTLNFGTLNAWHAGNNYFAGNVGIGTTSPQSKLNIENSAKLLLSESIDGTGKAWAGILGKREGGVGYKSQLSFFTNDGASLTDNSVEKMIITSLGNIGIGTPTPTSKFVVSNGGATGLEIDPASLANTTTLLSINRSGSAYTTMRFDAANYSFNNSGSPQMTILSGGNVGIGTTGPSVPLHIYNTSAKMRLESSSASAGNEPALQFFTAGGTSGIDWTIQHDGVTTDALDFIYNPGGIARNVLHLAFSGDVGIGTNDPLGYKLYVNGTTYINGKLNVKDSINTISFKATGLSTFGTNGGSVTIPSGGVAKVYVSGLTTSGNVTLGIKSSTFVTIADTLPSWHIPANDTLYILYKYNQAISYGILTK